MKNNNRCNKQKSNFARAAHFFCAFLCCCFVRLQRETSRTFLVTRFLAEMSYVFSFTFFSLPLIFTLNWWRLAFLILYCRYKTFMLFFQQKNFSLSFAGLAPTFSFLFLSLALYSKFVDMTQYVTVRVFRAF